MSLILDALRKAEAERQRGAVPGLHNLPALPPASRAATASRRWLWPAGLGLLLLAPIVAWLVWAGSDAGSGAGLAVGTASMPNSPGPKAPATPGPQAPVAAATAAATAAAPTPAAMPRVVSLSPAAPAVASPPAPPASAAAPIVTTVRRLADLAPEQRRALPPLAVSGSVWSEQAATRFVVIDGQVLREGDHLAPELVLLKLAPRSATLRWRDGLVEVPF